MSWLKQLLGMEETPDIQENKQSVGDRFRDFVSGMFKPVSISYTAPEEKLKADKEETANKLNEYFASTGEDARALSEDTQQPLVKQPTRFSPNNPYADWSEEQRKSDIRPDVASYADNTLVPAAQSRGIPPALLVSQWAVEGGRNIKDNPFGLMRNGEVLNYGSLDDNIRAYDETLRDIISTNLGVSKDEFKYEDYTPEQLLFFMQFQADGTPGKKRYEAHMEDPADYINMITNMPEWRYYL